MFEGVKRFLAVVSAAMALNGCATGGKEVRGKEVRQVTFGDYDQVPKGALDEALAPIIQSQRKELSACANGVCKIVDVYWTQSEVVDGDHDKAAVACAVGKNLTEAEFKAMAEAIRSLLAVACKVTPGATSKASVRNGFPSVEISPEMGCASPMVVDVLDQGASFPPDGSAVSCVRVGRRK